MREQRSAASPRVLVALPLLVALATYVPGVPSAGYVADDGVNLAVHARHGDLLGEWTTPTYLHAGGERGHIWRPLPATAQHAAALLMGRRAPVFRGLNLLLHLLDTALVAWVARRLGAGTSVAAALALAWTVHPALVEAVCWSSDVYDLAATAFVLAALGAAASHGRARLPFLVALTVAAGLCKESAVAFVPVLGLLAWVRGEGRRAAGGLVGAGAVGAVAYFVLHDLVVGEGYGAATAGTPLSHQVLAWLDATGWLFRVPDRAPMAHLFDPSDWRGPAVGALTLASLAGTGLWAWRRRGERAPLVLVGAWAILLVPAGVGIALVGVQPLRYAYLPLAVAFALAGLLPIRPMRGAALVLVAWCLAGLVRAVPRVADWQDDTSLWSAELAREPENPYAMGGLARALLGRGQAAPALDLWARAVDRAPEGLRVFDRYEERWLLAQAAFLRRRPDLALVQVSALIDESAARDRPLPAQAWCLVADSLDALGRSDEALAVEPRCADADVAGPRTGLDR